MTRSFKSTPIGGLSGGCTAQKKFKKQEHKRERKLVNQNLKLDRDLPDPKQFGNEWASPRDGKMWFGEYRRTQDYPKWMRK